MTDHPSEQVDRVAAAIVASMEEQCDFQHVGLIGMHLDWKRVARAALDAATPPVKGFGEQIGDFTLYPVKDGFVIAWGSQWLEGCFATVDEALASAKAQVGERDQ
jgi:hypothetical protein